MDGMKKGGRYVPQPAEVAADASGGVAVVMATRNGLSRGFIAESLQSIVSQSHRPVEIMVVDDGSTDGTAEWLRATYGDAIQVLEGAGAGVSVARNLALAASRAPFVAFLDDDDLFEPHKLSRHVGLLTADPTAVMVISSARLINGRGVEIGQLQSSKVGLNFPEALFGNDFTVPSTAVVRREAALAVGGFPENRRLAEDFDFFIRLSAAGRVLYDDEPLTKYRVHATQTSGNPRELEAANLDVVAEHARRFTGRPSPLAEDFFVYGAVLRAVFRRNWADARYFLRRAHRPLRIGLWSRRIVGMALFRAGRLKRAWRRRELRWIISKIS